jgi:vacuolar-type H+-ATPase subunit I/STV1
MTNSNDFPDYNNAVSAYSQKVEIELMKKDIGMISKLCEKMDTTIDKLQVVATELSKIVSLQEQKMQAQEQINKEVEVILERQQKEHTTDIKELNQKIDRTENAILQELQKVKEDLGKKINVIETWRYMIMGGISLAVFLIAQALNFLK